MKARCPTLRLVFCRRTAICEFEQNIRVVHGQLAELGITDFTEFAFSTGPDPGAALLVRDEQPHFAEEIARVQIGQYDLTAVLILDEHGDRALDDVVQHIGFIAGIDDDALRRVPAMVAMFQESLDGRVFFAWLHG
jgi:hypothetical protein